MKILSLAAAAAFLALPASAATYHFDYTVGTTSGGYFYDRDTNTSGAGDITVTGYIETDDTLGAITQANILSWSFEITGPEDSISIASTPTFGDYTYLTGSFNATAETLTATGWYRFYEYEYVRDSDTGYYEEYLLGQIYGYGSAYSNGYDLAQIYGYDRDCSSQGCSYIEYFGEHARTHHGGDTQFVGVSEVPLPASARLLLAGVGGLGLMRRRAT